MWAARAGIAYATSIVDSENPTVEQVHSVRGLLTSENTAKVLIR